MAKPLLLFMVGVISLCGSQSLAKKKLVCRELEPHSCFFDQSSIRRVYCTFQSGATYEGAMNCHGEFNGRGIYTSNGKKYEGGYKAHLRDGYGRYTWPSGKKYEGYYKAGRYHGYGKLQLKNGDWCEGRFRNNEKHGDHECHYPRMDVVEHARFSNGKRDGPSKIVFGPKSSSLWLVREITFKEGKKHGLERATFKLSCSDRPCVSAVPGGVVEYDWANGEMADRRTIKTEQEAAWEYEEKLRREEEIRKQEEMRRAFGDACLLEHGLDQTGEGLDLVKEICSILFTHRANKIFVNCFTSLALGKARELVNPLIKRCKQVAEKPGFWDKVRYDFFGGEKY